MRLRWGRLVFGLVLAATVVWVVNLTSPDYGLPDPGRHAMTPEEIHNTLRHQFQLDLPLDTRGVRCELEIARAGPLDKDVTYLFGCRVSWTAPEMTAWLLKISQGRRPDNVTPSLNALNTMQLDPLFEAEAVYSPFPLGERLWGGPTVFVNAARTEAMAYSFEYLAVD